jgi:hypothetical protein
MSIHATHKKNTRLLGHNLASLGLLLSMIFANTPIAAYDQAFLDHINKKHLNTFPLQQIPAQEPLPDFTSISVLVKSVFKPSPFTLPPVSDQDLYSLVIKAAGPQADASGRAPVASTVATDKMDVACGSGAKSGDHLAFRVSTIIDSENNATPLIHTNAGRYQLVKKISQPHTDITAIQTTQQAIAAIAQNSAAIEELTAALSTMSEHEKDFLIYYLSADIVEQNLLKQSFWNMPGLNTLNGSVEGLEIGTRLEQTLLAFNLCIMPLVAHTQVPALRALGSSQRFIIGYLTANYALSALFSLPTIGIATLRKNCHNHLQTQLIHAAHYIAGAKGLYSVLQKNPEIARHCQEQHKALRALAQPNRSHSAEFNELIELLDTNTFKGEASILSITGRVLRAHTLIRMPEVQAEFASIVNAIGDIDVLVALAQKIASTKDKPARYCFVQFSDSSTPFIKATELWNPFVHESKAVANTIELGADKPRNIILNGPNTGGKSTIGKAILINLILAQTFGIAAAEEMVITPFSNLDCFLNMTDDTAGGVSGLKAEVNRARELIEKVRTTSGFSFVLLDEIFTATSPDQAEKLAVKFLTDLSKQERCIFVNPAHFEGIIALGTTSPDCRNCHMEAITDTEGNVLSYTYKLAEGRSNVKNALQVAQESNALWD